MYSRFPRDSDRPIRLPEHYSGCAFSAHSPSDPTPERAHAEPEPPFSPSSAGPEEQADEGVPCEAESRPVGLPKPAIPDPIRTQEPAALPAGLQTLFGGRLPAFPGGMGFEELLLLGLILLLSHNDRQSDVVLWLALLLFCK